MPLFTVISLDDAEKTRTKIKEHFAENYLVPKEKPDITFVRSTKTAAAVADLLGFNNTEKQTDIVIKHELWYGYADGAIWEWGNQDV